MAAGAVIAREAGAQVTDLDGTDRTTTSRCTIAAALALFEDVLDIVQRDRTVSQFLCGVSGVLPGLQHWGHR
jgi:myo-inositol-1(or 4)-monophosphatase